MATVQDQSISFEFSREQEGFQLLELTPELLNIVESPSSSSSLIQLKSRGKGLIKDHKVSQAQEDAFLCLSDRTFHLRQVHSSNAIFLVKPIKGRSNSLEGNKDVSVSVIGSSKATLECLSHKPNPGFYLRALPEYRGVERPESYLRSSSPLRGEPLSKEEMMENTPCSDGEFELAWIELVAFEVHGEAFRPSPNVLLHLWRAIHDVATAEGLVLWNPFGFSELWEMVRSEGYPKALVNAFVVRIGSEPPSNDLVKLDTLKVVSFIGRLILQESDTKNSTIQVSDFIQLWQDDLPESLKYKAAIDHIKGSYTQPNPDSIQYLDPHVVKRTGTAGGDSTSQKPGVRKWHERFRKDAK